MYTCTQLATAKNTELIWKGDASALHLYVSHPLSKKQATAGKPQSKFPQTMNTYAQLTTAISKRI
jgi:hypothetical protein